MNNINYADLILEIGSKNINYQIFSNSVSDMDMNKSGTNVTLYTENKNINDDRIGLLVYFDKKYFTTILQPLAKEGKGLAEVLYAIGNQNLSTSLIKDNLMSARTTKKDVILKFKAPKSAIDIGMGEKVGFIIWVDKTIFNNSVNKISLLYSA
jgi:hypothetical protein